MTNRRSNYPDRLYCQVCGKVHATAKHDHRSLAENKKSNRSHVKDCLRRLIFNR